MDIEQLKGTSAATADRVDTHVYIGGFLKAADPAWVKREGITRVVKLFADDPTHHGGAVRHPGVTYLVIGADDVPGYDIRPALEAGVKFINEGRTRGEKTLVHCHMGISRSASVVLLYLMISKTMTLSEAAAYLASIRPIIRPNTGFFAHLSATDRRLQRLRAGGGPAASAGQR